MWGPQSVKRGSKPSEARSELPDETEAGDAPPTRFMDALTPEQLMPNQSTPPLRERLRSRQGVSQEYSQQEADEEDFVPPHGTSSLKRKTAKRRRLD